MKILKNLIEQLYNEYKKYSYVEKIFILCMMICSFAITAEASITRSVSASYFLDAYKAAFMPYAWMASLPLNFTVVALYNKFIPKLGPRKVMGFILAFALVFNVFCAFYLKSIYYLPFILYLWKDIFIIFLFHKLWSVIHSTIPVKRAKYIYGLFFGLGGLGSIAGSMVPGFFAVLFGTERLLLATLPLYFITYITYSVALRIRKDIQSSQDISFSIDNGDISHGLKLIKRSKLLKFILLLVVCMQVSSTILDYQFCTFLEKVYPEIDLRTQFTGRLFFIVNIVNIFLQFFGSLLLLKVAGLRVTHALIPLVLLFNGMLFFFNPVFSVICAGFGTIKSLDYSIFGITKEMLYLPLNVDEKFKAKAIIDVFAYRSSKGLVFFLISGLTFLYGKDINTLLTISLLGIFIIWIYSVLSMKEYFAQIDAEKPLPIK
jgi:AAA family ATP:ADP antiporter